MQVRNSMKQLLIMVRSESAESSSGLINNRLVQYRGQVSSDIIL